MKLLVSRGAYAFALCLNLGYNFKVLSARDAERNHVQKLNIVIQTVCLFHLALNAC